MYFIKAGGVCVFLRASQTQEGLVDIPQIEEQRGHGTEVLSNPISKSEKIILHAVSIEVLKDLPMCIKPGLQCTIYSTFTPQFMCWKYFDECFMDKNLLHTSLTKFNKLNKK